MFMGRARTWADDDLVQAVSVASSWQDVVSRLGLAPLRSNVNRLRRHAVRLNLGVAHLGPVIEVQPVNSPAPLNRKAVVEAVSSSDSWASALRKLGLPTVMRNYRRVQEIARSAGIVPARSRAATDYVPPGMPIPPPVTVRKGTHTEGEVLSALVSVGYNVLIPFGVARYDLVIEVADGFRRVQCKTARLVQPGMMRFNVCSGSPEGVRRTYVGEIDFFGVYLPDLGHVYLIPIEAVDGYRREVQFCLTDSGDVHGTRLASPYRLVAQSERALVS